MSLDYSARQDTGNYVEGVTFGDAVILKILSQIWAIPNVTITSTTLNDSGQINIPVGTSTAVGTATPICDAANTGTANVELRTVVIDQKVSEKVGGCFQAAGIADMSIVRLINRVHMMNLAKAYINTLNAKVIADATPTTVDFTGLSALESVNAMIKEFKLANKFAPDFIVMNYEIAEQLYNEIADRQTSMGDSTLVTGMFGNLKGVRLIEADVPFDMICASLSGIQQALPRNILQLPNMEGVNLNDASEFSFDVGSGIITQKESGQNGALGMFTWVHKVFGLYVMPEYVYIKPTVTP